MTLAERIAKAFHESYERQAPAFGYETREDSAVPWEDVPEQNKSLMIAVVDDLLANRVIASGNLVEAAASAVEAYREQSVGYSDPNGGPEALDALERRLGIPVDAPAVSGCTCGSHGAMDGHGYFCALRGPGYDL